MAKLKPTTDNDGNHEGYLMYCPGCRMDHIFRTEDWVTADGKKDTGWDFDGDMHSPTFNPSLNVNSKIPKEQCHFTLTDGWIKFFGDCFHELKSQTVRLPDYDTRQVSSRFYLNKPV